MPFVSVEAEELSDFSSERVGNIRIQSDAPVDEQQMLKLIEIAPGDMVSGSKIRKSIELLYATGKFSNILVDAQIVDGRADLTFILRTIYRLGSVELEGNTGIPGRKISRKIGLRKLEPYTPEKVLRAREQILEVLRQNGYYEAGVTQDVLLLRSSKLADVTFTVNAGPPTVVSALNFTGTPFFTRERLLEIMNNSDPGTRFEEHEFNRDMEQLKARYDSAGFLEHRISVSRQHNDEQNQIALQLQIEAGRQLILETVGYEFPSDVLRERVPIWIEHSYNDDTLEEGKRGLLQYLQSKGYYDATVAWDKELSAEQIAITYRVQPGRQYKVDEILVEGNQHFSDEEIREMMRTRESGITSSPLVARTFEADTERILEAYHQQGFLFARMTRNEIEKRGNGKIQIQLGIEEGPQTTVAQIRLKGNESISEESLKENFRQKVGEPVSEEKVKADSRLIIAAYSDQGYPQVRVENRLQLTRDKLRAAIEYTISEGEQIFVGQIVISGNYRTKREVIEENLFFQEGEPFSLRKIIESQSRLYSLDIFDRVEIDVPRPENLQKNQDVVIRLIESKPYAVSYGFGYQSFDLLRGIFTISDRNLFGTDRSIAFQSRGGFKEGRVLITYIDPHLFFHKVNSNISLFAEKRVLRESFSFRRYGVTLQAERKLSPERAYLPVGEELPPVRSLFFRYEFEDIDTTGTPRLDPFNRRFLAIHISSVSSSFVRDARDNIINPTKGNFFSTDLQFAGRILGSETDFIKHFTQVQHYVPVRSVVMAGSLRVGLSRAFRQESTELPLSQKFFAGGGRSIRGFELDTAGPLDELGQPEGGNALFIMNLEARFPIAGSFIGVVFFDYGNVFTLVSELDFGRMRESAGLGIRYLTPIGPLTLDWGYKLDRRFEPIRESPWEIFISVGHAF